MSREELRGCLQRESALNLRSDDIDREEEALKVKQNEITSLETLIDRRRSKVDRYSEESVDSFNALIARHRRLVRAYNESIAPFNARIAAYKVDQDTFNAGCAGKSYYESDMQAVRASLK